MTLGGWYVVALSFPLDTAILSCYDGGVERMPLRRLVRECPLTPSRYPPSRYRSLSPLDCRVDGMTAVTCLQ